MREPRPNHDPRPSPPDPPSTPLPAIFEDLYRSKFTGRVVMHFRSGYPSVIDVPGQRPRRWLVSPT